MRTLAPPAACDCMRATAAALHLCRSRAPSHAHAHMGVPARLPAPPGNMHTGSNKLTSSLRVAILDVRVCMYRIAARITAACTAACTAVGGYHLGCHAGSGGCSGRASRLAAIQSVGHTSLNGQEQLQPAGPETCEPPAAAPSHMHRCHTWLRPLFPTALAFILPCPPRRPCSPSRCTTSCPRSRTCASARSRPRPWTSCDRPARGTRWRLRAARPSPPCRQVVSLLVGCLVGWLGTWWDALAPPRSAPIATPPCRQVVGLFVGGSARGGGVCWGWRWAAEWGTWGAVRAENNHSAAARATMHVGPSTMCCLTDWHGGWASTHKSAVAAYGAPASSASPPFPPCPLPSFLPPPPHLTLRLPLPPAPPPAPRIASPAPAAGFCMPSVRCGTVWRPVTCAGARATRGWRRWEWWRRTASYRWAGGGDVMLIMITITITMMQAPQLLLLRPTASYGWARDVMVMQPVRTHQPPHTLHAAA